MAGDNPMDAEALKMAMQRASLERLKAAKLADGAQGGVDPVAKEQPTVGVPVSGDAVARLGGDTVEMPGAEQADKTASRPADKSQRERKISISELQKQGNEWIEEIKALILTINDPEALKELTNFRGKAREKRKFNLPKKFRKLLGKYVSSDVSKAFGEKLDSLLEPWKKQVVKILFNHPAVEPSFEKFLQSSFKGLSDGTLKREDFFRLYLKKFDFSGIEDINKKSCDALQRKLNELWDKYYPGAEAQYLAAQQKKGNKPEGVDPQVEALTPEKKKVPSRREKERAQEELAQLRIVTEEKRKWAQDFFADPANAGKVTRGQYDNLIRYLDISLADAESAFTDGRYRRVRHIFEDVRVAEFKPEKPANGRSAFVSQQLKPIDVNDAGRKKQGKGLTEEEEEYQRRLAAEKEALKISSAPSVAIESVPSVTPPERLNFDTIEEIITSQIGNQAKVEKLKIKAVPEGAKLSAEIHAGLVGGKILIEGLIVNNSNEIALRDLKVTARGYVKSQIESKLAGFAPTIKKYLETQYKKTVSSIQIVGSDLVVGFENVLATSPPSGTEPVPKSPASLDVSSSATVELPKSPERTYEELEKALSKIERGDCASVVIEGLKPYRTELKLGKTENPDLKLKDVIEYYGVDKVAESFILGIIEMLPSEWAEKEQRLFALEFAKKEIIGYFE